MKCKRAHILISAGMDGEIGEADRRALELHMESCPECRAYHAELADTLGVLRSHLNLTAHEAFDEKILDSLTPIHASDTRTTADALIDFFRPAWRQVAGSIAVSLLLAGMILVKAAPIMMHPSTYMPEARMMNPAQGLVDPISEKGGGLRK